MEYTLVLIRHGQSEWNLKNLFTGWKNPDLTQKGIDEAVKAGKILKAQNITFDIAYTSKLIRAQNTCELVLNEMGQSDIKTIYSKEINERNYGDLAGLNKDEARKKWGQEQVHKWRRSYDISPPGGESLKDTGARVWPFYLMNILPEILRGKSVLVAAHGNSLRALIMVLDKLSTHQITELNLATGIPIIYKFNSDSTVVSKEIMDDSIS